jgi:hypothetical protein
MEESATASKPNQISSSLHLRPKCGDCNYVQL